MEDNLPRPGSSILFGVAQRLVDQDGFTTMSLSV